jgi:DNA-binding Xre family transcriptional regulator
MAKIKATIRLDEILEKRGISKNKFSKMVGMHRPAIRRYFRKDSKACDPKLSTLVAFAVALDCSLDDLIKFKRRTPRRRA